jgi:hypothetical protein
MADTLTFSVSPTETTLGGTPITFSLAGETEAKPAENIHGVYIMDVGWSGLCNAETITSHGHHTAGWYDTETNSFSVVAYEIPPEQYAALGTYQVCAYVGTQGVKNRYEKVASATFTVFVTLPSAPPTPVAAPVAPVAVTPPPPVVPATSVVTPVTKPMSKLSKALKQCKKLRKHSKRVACEKRAKKKYKR